MSADLLWGEVCPRCGRPVGGDTFILAALVPGDVLEVYCSDCYEVRPRPSAPALRRDRREGVKTS